MNNRARRPMSMVVAIVLLPLILGLVPAGCSAGFDLSCGETTSETKTYVDEDYGYSFQYPGDWIVQQGGTADVTAGSSSEGGVSVYDPDGAVAGDYYIDLFQVSVYELAVAVDESMMSEIKNEVESMLNDLEAQGGWTRTEDLSDASVNAIDGYRVTYTSTTDGTPTTSTFYFLFAGDLEYQLTLQAATENWEEKQPEFEAIVAGFQPGAGR